MLKKEKNIEISTEIAQSLCRVYWGMDAEIKPLRGEFLRNFHVISEGKTYIMKFSELDPNLDELDFQMALLNELKAVESDYVFPQIVDNLKGESLTKIVDAENQTRIIYLLTWVQGRIWRHVKPITPSLRAHLGLMAGQVTLALKNLTHQYSRRNFDWDLAQSYWVKDKLSLFSIEEQKFLKYFLDLQSRNESLYAKLRTSVVHNDVNDDNVLVSENVYVPQVNGLIDFGDAIETQIINDVAIACTYASMRTLNPLRAACEVLGGYHKSFQIREDEVSHLYYLIGIRLVISVTKAKLNEIDSPENAYLQISSEDAWHLIKKWAEVDPEFALCAFRKAIGLAAHPNFSTFHEWAKRESWTLGHLFPDYGHKNIEFIDLSVGSEILGTLDEAMNLNYFEKKIEELCAEQPQAVFAGGYMEARALYSTDNYYRHDDAGIESRTIHMGIDFWLPQGTSVKAPLDGQVVISTIDEGPKEYGGLIVIKHKVEALDFYTLYGHLSHQSIEDLKKGDLVKKGSLIGYLGDAQENGGWVPHLHFQMMLSLFDYLNDFPGVCYPKERHIWKDICPNPNILFGAKSLEKQPVYELKNEILDHRQRFFGHNLSLHYNAPLHIVRGHDVYLINALGERYLDTVNNVAHVGHERYEVVQAGRKQMSVLNTNTRYLHPKIVECANALLATFPTLLNKVFFTNSGSEANELALRMMQATTNSREIIVSEMGYHGNSNACVNISSYKFDRKGGQGAPKETHVFSLPDLFRGKYQGKNATKQYVEEVEQIIARIEEKGLKLGGFICEPIISCGGQIVLPKGFLKQVYKKVREAGGICISDEVQVGCGRLGSHFWGFEMHEAYPDIVTIGKPLGNGHPIGAVVCTEAVANAFANGMEYFNTFGGNPVSMAIGAEVLHTINRENLQENAAEVGRYFKRKLQDLAQKYPIIADVRGEGLFLGFELADNEKNPLTKQAIHLSNRMVDLGVLMNVDGPDNNVLKIKPPITFSQEHVDFVIQQLNTILQEDALRIY